MGLARRIQIGDLRAGVTVAALLIPEGLAYSRIAGLPAASGLLAAVAGLFSYALVGQSRFAIVSATSASAAALAAALGRFSGVPNTALVFELSALTGLLFVCFGIARLGHIANFVSRPVLRGFAFGLAIAIVTRQLFGLFGLKPAIGAFPSQIIALTSQLPACNPSASLIGLSALAVILAMRRRLPEVPGAAVALIGGISLASAVDLGARGVHLVGDFKIAATIPRLEPIGLWAFLALLSAAAPIAMIIFAEAWGSIRALALENGDTLNPNRELIALGFANISSAVVGGQVVGAGFSASSANASAGAVSRTAGALAALGLVALLALAGRSLALLPEPVLAAVVIAALVHALDPRPLLKLWRLDRDFWIASAAAAGVLLVGVLWGLMGAVALSVFAIIRRISSPRLVELGRLGDSDDFVEISRHENARPVLGVLVLRPGEPLFFANVEQIMLAAEKTLLAGSAKRLVLSLEETGDLDATDVETLSESARRLVGNGRELRLARVKDPVRELLLAGGPAAAVLATTATRSVAAACVFVGPHAKEEQ